MHTILFMLVKLIEICSGARERKEMENEAKFSGRFFIRQFFLIDN